MTYARVPEVTGLDPYEGAFQGGTVTHVYGNFFRYLAPVQDKDVSSEVALGSGAFDTDWEVFCRFGEQLTRSEVQSDTHLTCESPPTETPEDLPGRANIWPFVCGV